MDVERKGERDMHKYYFYVLCVSFLFWQEIIQAVYVITTRASESNVDLDTATVLQDSD